MKTLLIILLVMSAAVILCVIVYLLFTTPKTKCRYCKKPLKQEDIVIYKGVSCADCKEKNKVIDSLDDIPSRFGF